MEFLLCCLRPFTPVNGSLKLNRAATGDVPRLRGIKVDHQVFVMKAGRLLEPIASGSRYGPMKPYLEGVADWLRRDFEVDVAPLPRAIALALAHLRCAEQEVHKPRPDEDPADACAIGPRS